MERQVTALMKALAQLDSRCGEISDQRAATEDRIHATFRRLQGVLDARETELVSQLDEQTQGKLEYLAAQREKVETALAQRNSCLHFMRESLRTGNEGDVVMMKTNPVEQIKELTTPFQPDFLEPNTKADIAFSASTDMTALCRNYGQVFSPGSPDPSKCHIPGRGTGLSALVGETSSAILQAINFQGKPCEEPIKSLECEIASVITGTRARCSVERRGQSQYEITYQPTIKGRHQLHIKAEGQHIRGSPFSVAVKSPVEKLGAPILTVGGVEAPWGVAINQRGEVVVAECGGHCISMFSPSGEKLRSFGNYGSGPGQVRRPHEVAIDSEGDILVVDSGNHRIQRFTSEGQHSATVGTEGSGQLQFSAPTGIAFSASNNKVYVTDTHNHRVQVLNSDLTYSSAFGKRGSGKGQFVDPWGIACDRTGNVYVADSDNHRIQVFTAEGKFLRMFGRHGHGGGDLDCPVGVAIDTSNMVYVSEWGNHHVSVFTSEGQFVMSFGRKGLGPGAFEWSNGLAVDSDGVVCVCESHNRIQMF
jgi:tripartite motif-containing protein 2/3/tripartite motif-containing protein 71